MLHQNPLWLLWLHERCQLIWSFTIKTQKSVMQTGNIGRSDTTCLTAATNFKKVQLSRKLFYSFTTVRRVVTKCLQTSWRLPYKLLVTEATKVLARTFSGVYNPLRSPVTSNNHSNTFYAIHFPNHCYWSPSNKVLPVNPTVTSGVISNSVFLEVTL